jgi:hypothetical protein
MDNLMIFKNYFIFLFLINTVSCVSVSLPKSTRIKSENVIFHEPGKPYKKIEDDSLDHIWRNSKNGNSISYLSNCRDQEDLNISSLYQQLKNHIDHSSEISQKLINYNFRKALKAQVKGDIDGVNTYISFLIFKKNSCTYVLSQVTLEDSYKTDSVYFEKFISEFKTK